MILHEKVQEIPKLNFPWPPWASDLTIDNVQKVVPCEHYNMLAWTCGFSSEPTLSEMCQSRVRTAPNKHQLNFKIGIHGTDL